MKTFIISDTHFNHEHIIWFAHRPFNNVKEMNETMIKNWNDKVSDKDLVIHLGDFVYGGIKKIKQIKNRLNGTIFLIKGNHDKMYRMKAVGITTVKGRIEVGNLLLTHKPTKPENGLINVHGHIHHWKQKGKINASVEHTNYSPVHIEEYFIKAKEMLGEMKCE